MIEVKKAKDYGTLITMNEMEPLEIGVICKSHNNTEGHIVLRTSSTDSFEVMDSTDPGVDCCWTNRVYLNYIRVFIPTESIFTIEISNKK